MTNFHLQAPGLAYQALAGNSGGVQRPSDWLPSLSSDDDPIHVMGGMGFAPRPVTQWPAVGRDWNAGL